VDGNDEESKASPEAGDGNGWIPNFDSVDSNDSTDNVSFSGIRTDPGIGGASDSASRRSIERDALRRYVRKRYLKTKGSKDSV